MQKKSVRLGFVFLVLILMISLLSAMVVADELTSCRDDCKALCEDEACRSECIQECGRQFGFDEGGYDESPIEETGQDSVFKDRLGGDEGVFKELKEEYGDEEIIDAGLTPDSAFYFIDELFDKFGDEVENREEKVAEIKAMVEEGKFEDARKAKEKYEEYAEKLEKESDPEKRGEARRSAAAIHNALEEIKGISEEEEEEFVNEIIEKESSIITAVEISSKIKALCEQLAELDPMEYSRMCKVDDEGPKWQKKLHKELTSEQEKTAREFVKIMKECFKTSGQDCRCEEIPFPDFSDACSQAAPLAVACDTEGNERACEKLNNLEMPELPEWLEPIWEELEGGMMEAQYDMHMPKECVKAGVKSPKECGKIMIQTHAPEECKEALLAADIQNEREGMKICDKIMMKIHSPECAEKGITDPKECAKNMMPPECREKDLSPRECKEIMDNMMMEGGPRGPGPGMDCKGIEDATKRLECYDKASSQTMGGFKGMKEGYEGNCMTESDWKAKKEECRRLYGEHAGDEPIMGDSGEGWECAIDAKCIDFSQGKMDYDEIKQKEQECADRCRSQDKAWDFSYGECKCFGGDYPEPGKGGGDTEPICDDCASQCPGASGTGCGPGGCECYYEDDEPITSPGPGDGGGGEPAPEPSSGGDGGGGEPAPEPSSGGDGGGGEPAPESNSEPEPSVTGGIIFDNEFLDYYLK